MEQWKLQTAVNNFTDACEADTPQIISAAKTLRRVYGRLRNPAQQQEVLEQVAPLLDDSRAHVRQLAACVMMNRPVEKLAAMPTQLSIRLYDNHDGHECFAFNWEDKVPSAVQQPAWLGFVAKHMVYLADKGNASR